MEVFGCPKWCLKGVFFTSKIRCFEKAPFLKYWKNASNFHQNHLMISRTSCLFWAEKRLKFDVDQAPPRNTQKSKMSIFHYTVSTLDPPPRSNRGLPGEPSEGPLGVKMGSQKGLLILVLNLVDFSSFFMKYWILWETSEKRRICCAMSIVKTLHL